MIRFLLSIILNLHWCIVFWIRIKKVNKDKMLTLQEKYDEMQKIILKIIKRCRVKIIVEGVENLPKENGYVLYSNHQGKFDGLAIIAAHDKQMALVMDESRSHGIVADEFYDALGVKRLKKGNPRQCLEIFNEINKEIVEDKKNFCIFPEGGYTDNHNNLQKFFTGCIHFVFKAKCPLVPVCLFDTYIPFNTNSVKKVSCRVHFLKPIEYDEYKCLNKNDLADLIKARIQQELDRIKVNYAVA